MPTTIRELTVDDAESFARLRQEALIDSPLAFASSPEDDRVSAPAAVADYLRRERDAVLLGAFQEGLVGSVGVYRDRHLKSAHKAHLWGMYVTPRHRRRGIAAELLAAAIDHARNRLGASQVLLAVSETAPAARQLYERAGFRPWGTESDALRHGGRSASELHMTLDLMDQGKTPSSR